METIGSVVVRFDSALFSGETILKACYWLSRDVSCEVAGVEDGAWRVVIKPHQNSSVEMLGTARDALIQHVADFALREKIEGKTADIRNLLLAKAFSEAGVLEDQPTGTFGDKIEEEKPTGMFKILGNSEP